MAPYVQNDTGLASAENIGSVGRAQKQDPPGIRHRTWKRSRKLLNMFLEMTVSVIRVDEREP